MRALGAILWREYASFFRLPLGWVVVALFLCLSGVFFMEGAVRPGSPATMREFFAVWWGLLLFLAPAVSMRLFSEELRSGTIETMLGAPVSEAVLVAGKYLAGVAFLLTMLAPTLVYVGVLEWLSRPDYGPVASGYLGLVLLSMLYLAVGTLASATTASQTLAFLGTLVVLLMLDVLPRQVAGHLPERAAQTLIAFSPSQRARDFYQGLIDTAHIAYFLLACVWVLAIATVVLQSRRWR